MDLDITGNLTHAKKILFNYDVHQALWCFETGWGYLSQIGIELKYPSVSQGFLSGFLNEMGMVCHPTPPGKVNTDSKKKKSEKTDFLLLTVHRAAYELYSLHLEDRQSSHTGDDA